MGALLYIDRLNIAITAKCIMPEYGLSEVQMGWIFSAFVLGYAICQIPGGWLSDRLSQRYGKRIGRCGIGFICLLLAGGFIFAGATVTNPYLAVLFFSLGAGLVFLSSTICYATAIDLCKAYAGTVH